MCGKCINLSERDKKRNGFISDAVPETGEAACGAIANANGELILLTAAVLRLEGATMATAIELRLHSCSQFSVFFNIFKRGGEGLPTRQLLADWSDGASSTLHM